MKATPRPHAAFFRARKKLFSSLRGKDFGRLVEAGIEYQVAAARWIDNPPRWMRIHIFDRICDLRLAAKLYLSSESPCGWPAFEDEDRATWVAAALLNAYVQSQTIKPEALPITLGAVLAMVIDHEGWSIPELLPHLAISSQELDAILKEDAPAIHWMTAYGLAKLSGGHHASAVKYWSELPTKVVES